MPDLKALHQAAIYITGGTDAPGIVIVPDGHGGYVVKRVPGWNPEQMVELSSALKVLAAASRLKQFDVAKTIVDAAARLAQSELGHVVGGEHGAGAPIVVVAGG